MGSRTPFVLSHLLVALVLSFATELRAADPAGRSWFDHVERDRDRGAGRIEDDSTWELRRLREERDVRLHRAAPRRDFERLDEERDRRLQLDALQRRDARPLLAPGRSDESAVLSRPPEAGGAVMSPTASQAAADEQALAAAKDKLDRSLRAVDAAEQRSLRMLKRRLNREGQAAAFDAQSAPVRDYHQRLRTGHVADYQRVRSRILGQP
jgi:hypothetical protein